MIVLVDVRAQSRRDVLLLEAVERHLLETIQAAAPTRVLWVINELGPPFPPEGAETLTIQPSGDGSWSTILDTALSNYELHDDVLCLAPLAGPLRKEPVTTALAEHTPASPAVIVRVRRLPSREHPTFLQPLPLAGMEDGRFVTNARLRPWPLVIRDGELNGQMAGLLPFDPALVGLGSQHMPQLPYADGSLELFPAALLASGGYRNAECRRYVEMGPHEGEGLEAMLYESC